jgi:hypothetical protein
MFATYLRALRDCPNWDAGNILGGVLPAIENLTESQIDELVAAYNETTELRGCFVFNGKKSAYYGSGLLPHLDRLGARKFAFGSSGLVEAVG